MFALVHSVGLLKSELIIGLFFASIAFALLVPFKPEYHALWLFSNGEYGGCRKAKRDVKNADDKTPAEVAELNSHAEVVTLLKEE